MEKSKITKGLNTLLEIAIYLAGFITIYLSFTQRDFVILVWVAMALSLITLNRRLYKLVERMSSLQDEMIQESLDMAKNWREALDKIIELEKGNKVEINKKQ